MSPTWTIIAIGALVAANCALIGTFLVLRRMSLLGDAISHAVLPGIVLAFLLTGSRAPLPMMIGAGAVGLITVALVGAAQGTRRLHEDASIGVVFPALFAVGVILVSRYAGQVDLDLDCVLHGEIAFAPWDTLTVAGTDLGPRALWILGGTLICNVLFVVLFYKELALSTFDPGLAASLGFSPTVLHYALMGMVSLTVVAAFESVGAILVVAMLVVPAATAHLVAERLTATLVLAVGLGVGASTLGYLMARQLDASIAGSMATVAGVLLVLALILAPKSGIVAQVVRRRRLAAAMADRLVLLHLPADGREISLEGLAAAFHWGERSVRRALDRLVARGWASRSGAGAVLTVEGRRALDGDWRMLQPSSADGP